MCNPVVRSIRDNYPTDTERSIIGTWLFTSNPVTSLAQFPFVTPADFDRGRGNGKAYDLLISLSLSLLSFKQNNMIVPTDADGFPRACSHHRRPAGKSAAVQRVRK